MLKPNTPIRLVLFDVFNTLVQPRSSPHVQYARVAKIYGLQVTESDVQVAFKNAFRQTWLEHANYGRFTGIADPDKWWTLVIQHTFLPQYHPLVLVSDYQKVIQPLSETLLQRFGSRLAYDLFPDVIPTLSKLTVPIGLATNSDSRILNVLREFHLDQFVNLRPSKTRGPTLSYFVDVEKPRPQFFKEAIKRNLKNVDAKHVLYVGDQIVDDFWGASDAGLQSVWLDRGQTLQTLRGQYKERRLNGEMLENHTIHSLTQVLDIVRNSHGNADSNT